MRKPTLALILLLTGFCLQALAEQNPVTGQIKLKQLGPEQKAMLESAIDKSHANIQALKNNQNLMPNALKQALEQSREAAKQEYRKRYDLIRQSPIIQQLTRRNSIPTQTAPLFYIAVSATMPKNMLRQYGTDALRYQGTLVFRGVNPGENLAEAMTRIRSLVGTEKGVPPIIIDPRPFTAFDIQHVPTIVISDKPIESFCNQPVKIKRSGITYPACPSAPSGDYMKISGAAPVRYALQQFEQHGSNRASRVLANAENQKPTDTDYNNDEAFKRAINPLIKYQQNQFEQRNAQSLYKYPFRSLQKRQ